MTASTIRVSRTWLALREPADAAARARDLVDCLRRRLPASGRSVIHDLGCGTGAMGRWLAPLLPGPQHWVAHDRDTELLEVAAAHLPGPAADGTSVTAEAKRSDITCLRADDLAGATLITASALLDVLTEQELIGLIALGVGSGCPMLLTLSVVGHVELTPADPLDHRVAAAFNAHQRRVTERGPLLGPDAVALVVEQCDQLAVDVLVRTSSWQLGVSQTSLTTAWFSGWVSAAIEQDDELAAEAELYARRRLAQSGRGELAVTVAHADLLISPG